MQRKSKQTGGRDGAVLRLVDAIEVELEGIFQKVLSANQKSDLQVYLTYADHLRFRQQRDRCLQVIDEALRLPAAAQPANVTPVMGLHAVAVEMALSKQDDAARFEKVDAAHPGPAGLLGAEVSGSGPPVPGSHRPRAVRPGPRRGAGGPAERDGAAGAAQAPGHAL